MIKQLKFKSGAINFTNKLEISPTEITIFVGPNNSGKSRALIEIENFCRTGKANSNSLIFEKISYEPYNSVDFISELEKIIHKIMMCGISYQKLTNGFLMKIEMEFQNK